MSRRDLAHLDECFDAFGLNESISNGHFMEFNYDTEELNLLANILRDRSEIESRIRSVYAELDLKYRSQSY